MPRLSDAPSPEDAVLRGERDRELRYEYQEALTEQELFDHPSWEVFERRLLAEQGTQQRLLETCDLQDVPSVRARLALARYLLSTPDKVRARVAELHEAFRASSEDEA